MRILVASHLLPAASVPHAGGPVIYHLIRELTARGHTVDVLTKLVPQEQPYLAELQQICHQVITVTSGATKAALLRNSLSTGVRHPRDLVRWRGRRNNLLLAYELERLLDRYTYDVVQLELVQMLPLARVVRGRAPVVQVVHDLGSKLAYRRMQHARSWKRHLACLYWHHVLLTELGMLQDCDAIAAHGAFDLGLLRTLLPSKPSIRGPLWLPLACPFPPASPEPPRLLFVGALWRQVNDEAARFLLANVWPRIQARLPHAELAIVGHGPSEALRLLASAATNVTLTGSVLDLKPWYARSHVAIAPVFVSGGILMKVLDAMALGRPVITTPAGNEGVGAQPGRDLVVADDPEALAVAAVELLLSPQRAAEIAAQGRQFVETTFHWQASVDRYEQLIASLNRRRYLHA